MPETLTVSRDFLERALGAGEGGDPHTVGIFPETLPADFPLTLPPLPGLRVLGSVKSVAPRWSFGNGDTPPERAMWRVFLDVAGNLPDVMQTFQATLRRAGWEDVQLFGWVFVEAEKSQWMAVHPVQSRQLNLNLRQHGELTQVWINLRDSDPENVRHLLGQPHHPHFDHYQAPLPTLTLPPGWKAQPGQGQGGPVRSQDCELYPPDSADDLMPHLLPQLAAQGWELLHQDGEISIFRTALGVGTLQLKPEQQHLAAQIVHVTSEKGDGSASSTYTLRSQD